MDIYKSYDGISFVLVSNDQYWTGSHCFATGDISGIMYVTDSSSASSHYASRDGGRTWGSLNSQGNYDAREISTCITIPGTDDYLQIGGQSEDALWFWFYL